MRKRAVTRFLCQQAAHGCASASAAATVGVVVSKPELIAALVAIVLGANWGLPALWQSIAGATDVSTGTMARLALSTDPARLATYVWMALTAVAAATFYLLHRTLFSEY